MIKEITGGGKKNLATKMQRAEDRRQKTGGAFLLFATDFVARNHDAAIGKSPLLREGVRVVVPARFEQFREDVFSTGIRFGTHTRDFT